MALLFFIVIVVVAVAVRTTKNELSFVWVSNKNLWDVDYNRLSNKVCFVGDGKGLNIYRCLGQGPFHVC